MLTVLICADAGLENDLVRTPFWREDVERYVAEQADDARMLVISTEPHILVVDSGLPGADELVVSLADQYLPNPLSIVVLNPCEAASQMAQTQLGGVNTVLSLPPGPHWDEPLLHVLKSPTRQQVRFDVNLGVETRPGHKASVYRGTVVNISAGGVLIDGHNPDVRVGDDVHLVLQAPDHGDPVEGRGRVVRQPLEQYLGVRFEAFSGKGDTQVRDFLARLAQNAP